eukprot:GHRR01036451.1.p1 GENE.GHRR01036451.1~~GHRR01036451.1.p1  ORF type:complete len:117 (-),score=34.59 GHRR01036451.1:371-721(-)
MCGTPVCVPQIHVLGGGKKVHIYSRNAEDMTPRYPDIVARLPACLAPGTDSIVIDGEAVAWDPEKNKILPFQVGYYLYKLPVECMQANLVQPPRADIESDQLPAKCTCPVVLKRHI